MPNDNQPPAERIGLGLLFLLPAAKLLIHFAVNATGGYGYFRDELYFIACGERLAWGYVDQPPMVALVAAASRALLGDSVFAIRFFPAVAGALVILLTGMIARVLGGQRFACALAQLAALASPVLLAIHGFLSMNAFEHLFWALAAYLLLLIVKHDRPKLWLAFGAICGLGLQTKHSIIFFGVAVLAALALTPARRYLANPWLWAGGAVAFLMALPHALWQWANGFPMWELLRMGQLYKNAPFALGSFLWGMFLEFHPASLLIGVAALWFFLISAAGKPYRLFGWLFVALFAVLVLLRAKPYYIAPIYPLLYAGGAVGLAVWTANRYATVLRSIFVALLLAGGAGTAPLVLPVLPVETYLRIYSGFSGPPTERHRMGPLPQMYADMHGWPEMAATVARVYHTLSPEEKTRTAIYCSNYGEAGAVDFFGPQLGLPKAISGHNNYYLWGPPQHPVEIVITVGEPREDVLETFEQVEEAARFEHPYAMPYEQRHPIYMARKPRFDLRQAWPNVKKYI